MNWYAPPPGSPTGVADYAEVLCRELGQKPLPVPVYHLGNNRLHAEIYARAVAKSGVASGVVVLHDAVLHHFLLGTLARDEYIAEFVYNYGEWTRHLAEELWRDRAASGVDPRYFRYPMLRRAVENALAVIVHNPGAAALAREHGARDVRVIPHFYAPESVDDGAVAAFRTRLGIGPRATLFGIFGYLRETKRVMPTIAAFRRLNRVRPDTALLIAGEPASADLARLLESEQVHPAIHRLQHLSESEFGLAAAAVDCCVNLRYPAAGESSGIATRLMGLGKPVIVTEGLETSDYPEETCLRVPAGAEETAILFTQMAFVAEFRQVAEKIGKAAARYVLERQSLGNAVRQYREVLDSVAVSSHELT